MTVYGLHKKARFDYEILDTIETGIELLGFEVKAVRAGKVSLEGSHIIIRGGEAYVVGLQISPYQSGNTPEGYNPLRTKKLLLSKKEIGILAEKDSGKGLTIVPLSLYNKGTKIKLEVAIVRGKKLHDKRETIKKRDTERELRRDLKIRL